MDLLDDMLYFRHLLHVKKKSVIRAFVIGIRNRVCIGLYNVKFKSFIYLFPYFIIIIIFIFVDMPRLGTNQI